MRPLVSVVLASILCSCASNPAPEPATGGGERTVFVVRHAESWKNVQPVPDLPPEQLDALTPKGQDQARALGQRLKGRGVGLVLYSPTGRTRETATAIAEALGVEAREAAALAPLKSGKTPDGEPVTWPWREEQWRAGQDPRPTGSESLADGVRRALELIEQTRTSGALVLVTHGDVAAGLVGEAAGTAMPERWGRHQPPGGSVTETRRAAGGAWTLGEQWTP